MSERPQTPDNKQQEPFTPWHAEPWVWFIITLLTVTFCWGGVRLYTVFANRDSVVIDDYYKRGKSINHDMTRTITARSHNIEAVMTIDELIGEVRIKVSGDLTQWPDELKLSFLSPAFADQDRIIPVRRSATGDYVGQLPDAVTGRYYLQLETNDQPVPEEGYKTGMATDQRN